MKRQIIIALCFIIVIAVVVFFIRPEYQKTKELSKDIVFKETELNTLKQYYAGLEALNQKTKQYQAEVSTITYALPAEFSFPSLLDYLQRTASENGVLLKGFGEPSVSAFKAGEGPTGEGAIKMYNFNLSLSGSYDALKSFLSVLEQNARFINVENISFASPKGEASFNFSLIIKFYSY